VSLFPWPGKQTLTEYDAALASRLTRLLVETMQKELATPELSTEEER
jgi:hypothetical protein